MVSKLPPATRRRSIGAAAAATATLSLLVSYGFFQSSLYWPIRMFAFGVLGEVAADGAIDPPGSFAAIRFAVGHVALSISEALNGPPFLAHEAWLRLALPGLAGLAAMLMPAVLHWSATARLARRPWRRNGEG